MFKYALIIAAISLFASCQPCIDKEGREMRKTDSLKLMEETKAKVYPLADSIIQAKAAQDSMPR